MRLGLAGRLERRRPEASALEARLRRGGGVIALALFVTATLLLVTSRSVVFVLPFVVASGLAAYLVLTQGFAAADAMHQAVVERAAAGIARVALDGTWLEVNQAYCDILGYSRRELLRLTYRDLTHPDDLAIDVAKADELLAGKGRSYTMEKRYVRKDGAVVWVELVVSLVRSADGEPSYFVASAVDISARKAAEAARDDARRFAEDLAFVCPALLYVYDLQAKRMVYASRETRGMLGRDVDEIRGLGGAALAALVHADDLPRAAEQLACVTRLADHEACECALRVEHADRSWRWVLGRNAVFRRDAEGHVVQTVGSAIDITALTRSEQSAAEARALLDALYVQAPIGLGYYDRALRCVLVNEALARMTGLSASEHIGRSLEEILPGPTGRDVAEDMRRVIDTGACTTGLPVQARTRSEAEPRDWLISYYPVRIVGPEVIGVGCIAEEVTQRRRIERERERLVVELREAVRARDDFLSIASHELRTPLTTITLGAEHLVRLLDKTAAAPSKGQLRTIAQRLQNQGERLERLVGTLLDVARIAQGRVQLFPEELDVTAVVREQVERLAESAARAGSTIRLEAAGPINGCFDRTRLEQIVDNLVSNAIKFGAGKPILVAIEATAETIRLTVRDKGLGIAREDRARIFERFERAVSQRHYGGLGLGLWVTRQIVEAMGGTVFVTGEVGQGSTLTVEWPRIG